MLIDERIPDGRYHHHRAEQERTLARYARSAAARDSHIALMRLHETKRDGTPMPG